MCYKFHITGDSFSWQLVTERLVLTLAAGD